MQDFEIAAMALRDWFAGQYLAGRGHAVARYDDDEPGEYDERITAVATTAYRIADAMLAARSRPTDAGDE